MLKRISGKQNKIDMVGIGKINHPPGGLEARAAHALALVAEMDGFHADLPVGRMDKLHRFDDGPEGSSPNEPVVRNLAYSKRLSGRCTTKAQDRPPEAGIVRNQTTTPV